MPFYSASSALITASNKQLFLSFLLLEVTETLLPGEENPGWPGRPGKPMVPSSPLGPGAPGIPGSPGGPRIQRERL